MKILTLLLLLIASPAFAAEGDFNWNFRTQPLGWVIAPNARVDYKLGEQWTLGLAATALDRKIKAVKLRGTTAGLLLDYAFNSALTNSWILEGGVFYGGLTAEAKNAGGQTFSRALPNAGARMVAGYQWYWGRFNLSLDMGADYNSQGDKNVEDSSGAKVEKIPINSLAFVSEGAIGLAF
jgi:hypothetical protein